MNSTVARASVAVVGVSTDSVEAQRKFREEQRFPFPLLADTDKKVSTMYQAINAAGTANNRHLYVIDKAGKVTYKQLPFRWSVQDAYTELDAEIDKLSPPKPSGGTP